MIWRWFSSRTFRRAMDLHRHVSRLVRAQRDVLALDQLLQLDSALESLRATWRDGSVQEIREAIDHVRAIADEHLDDASKSMVRESAEMLLVALTIVLALRTFFVQPMKIPTGSMQPTLYGVTAVDLRTQPEMRIPSSLARWMDRLLFGRSYYRVVATSEGKLTKVEDPEPCLPLLKGLPFLTKQRFQVGGAWHTLWFPPKDLPAPQGIRPDLAVRPEVAPFLHAGMRPDRVYRVGEELIKLMVVVGDHILVDRFTYNFRRPRRGEIIVFETTGINLLQQGTHYIKRLVGVGGDRVRIGDDRHLVLNGKRLGRGVRGFQDVYNFSGPPVESRYSGHMNETTAIWYRQPPGSLAPLFPNERKEFLVRTNHYLVMGDNTINSHDGRRWGDFPQENVIGRFLSVYWPVSERFGFGHQW